MKCLNGDCHNTASGGPGRFIHWIMTTEAAPYGMCWICEQCWREIQSGGFALATTKPRDDVRQFAYRMEVQLRANEDKGGWHACSAEFLLSEAQNHLNTLKRNIRSKRRTTDEHDHCIGDDGPDVANFMMMIYSLWNSNSLERQDGSRV